MNFGLETQYIFLIAMVALFTVILFANTFLKLISFFKKSFWAQLQSSALMRYQIFFSIFALLLVLILTSVATAQPRWGIKTITTEKNAADILFVLDVSKSMQALDMSIKNKALDRLTAAKLLISDMVNKHPENNYGLVVFAGDAFVLSPITFDVNSFVDILTTASSKDVAIQGTDVAKALSVALSRFNTVLSESKEDVENSKAIVLISDGGEDMNNEIFALIQEAKTKHIPIYTLGIGDSKGVPIPEGQDAFGRIIYKQHNGQRVYTKLNEVPLKQIAKETGGEYWHLQSGKDLDSVAKKLNELNPAVHIEHTSGGLEDQYQLFLLIAFLIWVFYLLADEGLFLRIYDYFITRKNKQV